MDIYSYVVILHILLSTRMKILLIYVLNYCFMSQFLFFPWSSLRTVTSWYFPKDFYSGLAVARIK